MRHFDAISLPEGANEGKVLQQERNPVEIVMIVGKYTMPFQQLFKVSPASITTFVPTLGLPVIAYRLWTVAASLNPNVKVYISKGVGRGRLVV